MPSSPGGTIIPVEYDLAKIEAVISENTNIFMTKLYKSKYSLDIIEISIIYYYYIHWILL